MDGMKHPVAKIGRISAARAPLARMDGNLSSDQRQPPRARNEAMAGHVTRRRASGCNQVSSA
jgi:hypothetical protein